MTCDDMGSWQHDLLCEPMNDNPWTYGVLLVVVVLMVVAAVGFGRLVDLVRRRIMFGNRDKDAPVVTGEQQEPVAQDRQQELSRFTAPQPDGEGWKVLGTTDDGGVVHFRPDPLTDSGVHAMPEVTTGHKVACTHCEGNGYVIKTTSDLLRESIALVGDGGDMIVKEFYTRLFAVAPDLAALFPSDLLGTDETKRQRDRLLKAIVALSESYDPNNPAGMDRLDTALAAFGRSHSKFAYPDGSERGATLEQYAVVKAVLFEVLVMAAGKAWLPAYTEAWSEAYDYAAGVMLAEARRGGQQFARMPRA